MRFDEEDRRVLSNMMVTAVRRSGVNKLPEFFMVPDEAMVEMIVSLLECYCQVVRDKNRFINGASSPSKDKISGS